MTVVGGGAVVREQRIVDSPTRLFWRFQEEELKKYQPLAAKMGIRK